MPLFFQIMLTVFIAEMGDKTQLMMIAMAARYQLSHIFIGAGLAILVLNALAVGAGALVSAFIPMWLVKLAASFAFLYFAWSTLFGAEEEEESSSEKGSKAPILAVFGSFFLAELGDKTQLTALTFAANAGLSQALSVWGACSIGLFAADVLGVLLGYFLQSKVPENVMNQLTFALFTLFGLLTIREGLALMLPASGLVWPFTFGCAILFAAVCLFSRGKRQQ